MDASTSASATVATGITVAGVALGISYDTLVAGFAGGLVAMSFISGLSLIQRFLFLLSSTLTGAYVSPVILMLLAKFFDMATMPANGVVISAFLTGLGTQVGVPLFLKWLKKRGEAQGV